MLLQVALEQQSIQAVMAGLEATIAAQVEGGLRDPAEMVQPAVLLRVVRVVVVVVQTEVVLEPPV